MAVSDVTDPSHHRIVRPERSGAVRKRVTLRVVSWRVIGFLAITALPSKSRITPCEAIAGHGSCQPKSLTTRPRGRQTGPLASPANGILGKPAPRGFWQ